MKRHLSRAFAAALAAAGLLATAGPAGAAPTLPRLSVAMDGHSISVGGTLQSGALNIVSTTKGEPDGNTLLVRLNPGVTAQQVYDFIKTPASHDTNSVRGYGSIVLAADAPKGKSTVQATLQPGDYIAFDAGRDDPTKWPRTEFTITRGVQSAVLPSAKATVRAIDFAFRAPKVLHRGELVRFENDGWVAHMIIGIRARDAKSARRLATLMRAGNEKQAQKLAVGFAPFQGPVSHGAVQQLRVHAKRGYYVLACFEDTQDGRAHTMLGMVRLIRIR